MEVLVVMIIRVEVVFFIALFDSFIEVIWQKYYKIQIKKSLDENNCRIFNVIYKKVYCMF